MSFHECQLNEQHPDLLDEILCDIINLMTDVPGEFEKLRGFRPRLEAALSAGKFYHMRLTTGDNLHCPAFQHLSAWRLTRTEKGYLVWLYVCPGSLPRAVMCREMLQSEKEYEEDAVSH